MKRKIFEPARHNEESPAAGMAAVNTFNEDEIPMEEMIREQTEKNISSDPENAEPESREAED